MNNIILCAALLFAQLFVSDATDTCSEMLPLCADWDGTEFEFTMDAVHITEDEEGNDYDCLGQRLFDGDYISSWHYVTIAATSEPGAPLVLEIVSLDGSAIDFVMWGPFDSPETAIGNCGGLVDVVDCAFAGGPPIEYPTVDSTQPGEVYVIMITGFNTDTDGLMSLAVVSKAFIEQICPCEEYGLGLLMADGSPHECTCQQTCNGYFCNTVGFVEDKVGASPVTGLCGEFATCCCNCPNCDSSGGPLYY